MEHYLSSNVFDGRVLDTGTRKIVWRDVLPALVNALDVAGCVPVVSRDFRDIAQFQADHADAMALFQTSDPRYHPDMDEGNCFALFLQDRATQRLVGCAGLRLMWLEDSLAQAMTSLRFFFKDPRRMAPRAYRCEVTAPAAYRIASCQVAVSVSLFVEPAAQRAATAVGVKLVVPLMRLLHIWGLAHWTWSALIGLAEKEVAVRYAFDPHGFQATERGVFMSWRDREVYLMSALRGYVRTWAISRSCANLDQPLGIPGDFGLARRNLRKVDRSTMVVN